MLANIMMLLGRCVRRVLLQDELGPHSLTSIYSVTLRMRRLWSTSTQDGRLRSPLQWFFRCIVLDHTSVKVTGRRYGSLFSCMCSPLALLCCDLTCAWRRYGDGFSRGDGFLRGELVCLDGFPATNKATADTHLFLIRPVTIIPRRTAILRYNGEGGLELDHQTIVGWTDNRD